MPRSANMALSRNAHRPAQLLARSLLIAGVIMALLPLPQLMAQQAETEKSETKKTKDKSILEKTKDALKAERDNIREQRTRLDERLKKLENLYLPKHWTDPANGFAIGGFDPIAYFEQGKPRLGKTEYQGSWHGTSWRFETDGNRRIFAKSPSIYAPKYAGHDPYALSQGIIAEGAPIIWSVINGQLFLFQNTVNKYLWSENYKKITRKTRENWAALSVDLPSYKALSNKSGPKP